MSQRKKYKICLVGDCLSGGGAERVQASLSDFFVRNNISVHHVIFISRINYPFSGKLFNLGEIDHENFIIRKIKKILAFRKYIKQNEFNVVVDFRVKYSFIQEFLIRRLIYPSKTYYTVHSSNLDLYFPKFKFLADLIHWKGKKVISVSEGIAQKTENKFNWKNLKIIYNPININVIDVYTGGDFLIKDKFILAVGRMDNDVKQFDKLIDTYIASDLISKNIKLIFLGTGKLKKKLMQYAIDKGINNWISFEGFQSNPFGYMKKAEFLVLSSKFEGLPSVLIESLACGTPVISFDCEYGPSEIVQHKKNGLLVENQNFNALKDAMNLMISDQSLYQFCKSNTTNSVGRFEVNQIGQQWLELFKIKK